MESVSLHLLSELFNGFYSSLFHLGFCFLLFMILVCPLRSFSIFLNELTVECYDAMGSVISILRHLTNMMNICFFIDRRLLSHSLSAMSNLTEGTKLRSQRRSILPSDVDTLTVSSLIL